MEERLFNCRVPTSVHDALVYVLPIPAQHEISTRNWGEIKVDFTHCSTHVRGGDLAYIMLHDNLEQILFACS